jgi:hypothetical protein
MTNTVGSDSRIESYLAQVRVALRGLPDREIDDILRELRSHAVELAGPEGADVETALRSLGDPVELAETYRAQNRMIQAECASSTLVILQGLRHASRNRIGRFTATVLYVLGYVYVVTLWAAAVEKLFEPSRIGLWYAPGSFWPLHLVTDGRQSAGATELLGWWLVPAAVVAGWVLRYAIDHAARWWIRHYRQSKTLYTA